MYMTGGIEMLRSTAPLGRGASCARAQAEDGDQVIQHG